MPAQQSSNHDLPCLNAYADVLMHETIEAQLPTVLSTDSSTFVRAALHAGVSHVSRHSLRHSLLSACASLVQTRLSDLQGFLHLQDFKFHVPYFALQASLQISFSSLQTTLASLLTMRQTCLQERSCLHSEIICAAPLVPAFFLAAARQPFCAFSQAEPPAGGG